MNFQKKSDTSAYIQHIARRVTLSICRKYKSRFCCKWLASKLMLIRHFFLALDENYKPLKFQVFLWFFSMLNVRIWWISLMWPIQSLITKYLDWKRYVLFIVLNIWWQFSPQFRSFGVNDFYNRTNFVTNMFTKKTELRWKIAKVWVDRQLLRLAKMLPKFVKLLLEEFTVYVETLYKVLLRHFD